MSWRTLDFLDYQGELTYRRAHLVASDASEEHTVNLNEVSVIMVALGVRISSGLLLKCAELGIPIHFCDWRGVPVGSLNGWSQHTRVGARQIAQASLSLPRRKSAWAAIVKAKIRGQASVAGSFDSRVEQRLREIASTVRSGDPGNREGLAAKIYWSKFGSTGLTRIPGDGSNVSNAMLNYGYTLLRGSGIRAVNEAGLWPALGIFHRGRSNAFNLVDDLIEPFRPSVDAVVLRLHSSGETALDQEAKRELAAVLQQPFSSQGYSVATVIRDFARAFGKYAEGDENSLVVPTWEPLLETV